MAQKLFGVNKPNTNLRKNVFDLSATNKFTLSAGMLVPCLVRELNPGEKVELSLASITRAQPLNTAAFVRMNQYYHAFFVPYKQLWSPWDNFINGVDYRQSTRALKAGESIPAFTFKELYTQLFKAGILAGKDAREGEFSSKNALDALGYSYVYGISRLLDMLGYGFEITIKPSDYITNWEKADDDDVFVEGRGGHVGEYHFDHRGKVPTKPKTPPPASDIRVRIASFADFCKFVFNNAKVFLGVNNTAYASSAPAVQAKLTQLIYDCFGEFRFNPFRLLAYQKIYYDFYRRQDYEGSKPEHYNIDDFNGDLMSMTDTQRLLGIFQLRYRWLAKDYFTGVVPSELFGTENLVAKNNVNSLLPEFRQAMTNSFNGADSATISSMLSDGRGVKLGHNAEISTRSIRAIYAIEKLMRLTRRAGDYDYISQTSAHYGVDVPKGRGEEVSFLGGWSSQIDISEVVTTALTEKGDPAQIYGRGVGTQQGKDINYEAKEHGLLMVITSIVPDSDYSGVGMNNFNAKLYRGDFFHPEFQDLGLQPIMSHELAFQPHKLNRSATDKFGGSVLLGYAPRYAEYKTACDELHGEFRSGKEFSPWVSSIKVLDNAFFTSSGIKPSALLVSPSQLDSIFSVRFDGTESTDQFMCVCNNICKIIRPMSVTGQNL
ncbi:major capsid protein [Microvirus D_HF4_124]|nr:major capsid protein [Microvirus D_HF4_124]